MQHPPPILTAQPTPSAHADLSSNPRYRLHTLHSRILPGDRTISIYLPPHYLTQPERRFPVFYLHDGQNLFDPTTSYIPGSTWNAHTTADRLLESCEIEPVILIGIANLGDRRMAEYTPTPDHLLGGGQGDLYGRLLVEELLPAIDSLYRTLPGAASTALGGSSLGGLMSLYLGLTHPDSFGRLAILSPSVWWDHTAILKLLPRLVDNLPPAHPLPRIWLDMGTAEGLSHLHDTRLLHQLLLRLGWRSTPDSNPNLLYREYEGAQHNEHAWSDRFADLLRFLFPAT